MNGMTTIHALALLLASSSAGACRTPPSEPPAAAATAPEAPAPVVVVPASNASGVARAQSHQHADQEAVIKLSSHDRGERDIPPFEIRVFSDGCFRGEFGYQMDQQELGAVHPRVVQKILQDAQSLGMPGFAATYHLPHNPMPDHELEILFDTGWKRIEYSPVMAENFAADARAREGSFALELFTVHLIGARVFDLIGSRR